MDFPLTAGLGSILSQSYSPLDRLPPTCGEGWGGGEQASLVFIARRLPHPKTASRVSPTVDAHAHHVAYRLSYSPDQLTREARKPSKKPSQDSTASSTRRDVRRPSMVRSIFACRCLVPKRALRSQREAQDTPTLVSCTLRRCPPLRTSPVCNLAARAA